LYFSFVTLTIVDDSDSEGGGNEEGAGDIHAEASVAEEALLNDPKLGAKKRAKLEAKIEKRAQREVLFIFIIKPLGMDKRGVDE